MSSCGRDAKLIPSTNDPLFTGTINRNPATELPSYQIPSNEAVSTACPAGVSIYTFTLDSHNAVPNNTGTSNALEIAAAKNNPTNNVLLPGKNEIVNNAISIEVATFEMNMTQQIIEAEWSNVHLCRGIKLVVSGETDFELLQFSVERKLGDKVTTNTALLPPYLNPVLEIDTSDPLKPIFTMQFPHMLSLAPVFGNWGGIVRLIATAFGTNSATTYMNFDTTLNPAVTIIDDNRFAVTTGTPFVPFASSAGTHGYLWTGPIPTPSSLASLINASFQQSKAPYSVSFDLKTARFQMNCLQTDFCPLPGVGGCGGVSGSNGKKGVLVAIPKTGACTPQQCFTDNFNVFKPVEQAPSITVLVPENSLPGLMGFTCGNQQCQNQTGMCRIIANESFIKCCTKVTFEPGNYNFQTLPEQWDVVANRMYFDLDGTTYCAENNSPTPNDPDTTYQIVFMSTCGQCHNVVIPPGIYNPYSLAHLIETKMNDADPEGKYEVSFDGSVFIFETANDNQPFSLEFRIPDSQPTAPHLGFSKRPYRGKTRYQSDQPLNIPMECFPGTSIPTTWANVPIRMSVSDSEAKLTFAIEAPVALPKENTRTEEIPNNPQMLQVTNDERAHGYNLNDVVLLRNPTTGDTGFFPVVDPVNALSFIVDTGSADPTPFTDGASDPKHICVSLAGPFPLNFMFQEKDCNCDCNSIKPEILGFPEQVIEWNPLLDFIKAPFPFNLDPPPYVLLEIIPRNQTTGATRTQHEFKGNSNNKFIAKIPLYPALREERETPMFMDLTAPQRIQGFTIRIMTPDLKEYQFHGAQWSMTLKVRCLEGVAKGTCL